MSARPELVISRPVQSVILPGDFPVPRHSLVHLIPKDISPLALLADPNRLPFSDNSLSVARHTRGLMSEDELNRVDGVRKVVRKTGLLDMIPLFPTLRGISREFVTTLGAVKRGEIATKRHLKRNAIDLYDRHGLQTHGQLIDYFDHVDRNPSTRVLTFDIASGPGLFIVTRIADSAVILSTMRTLLSTDDIMGTIATGVAKVGLTNGLWVKQGWFLLRAGAELVYMAKETAMGRPQRRWLGYPVLAGMVALSNTTHAAGYLTQPLLGGAHDPRLAFETVNALRRRTSSKKYYVHGREWSLATNAQDEKDKLKKRENIPVLTIAEIGNDRYDLKTSPLTRGHRVVAEAVAQALNPDGHYIDVTRFANFDNYNRLMRLKSKAELVARSPRLASIYGRFSPLIRNVSGIDSKVKGVTNFFADAIFDRDDQTPVIAGHYVIGNAMVEHLAKKGDSRPVIYVVTDPDHVHDQYLLHRSDPRSYFFVFNQDTKQEFVARGVDEDKIFVTGYPLHDKLDTESRRDIGDKVRLAVFTGGLGTNAHEIEEIASGIDLKRQQAVFYCGTHMDIAIRVMASLPDRCKIRLVPAQNLDAIDFKDDEVLIVVSNTFDKAIDASYNILNWADVVASKPADVAIEAAMAGKLIVDLNLWGPQEEGTLRLLEQVGAIVNVATLNKTGKVLNDLHRSGLLQEMVDALRLSIDEGRLFVDKDTWRNNLIQAVEQVQQQHRGHYSV